MAKQAELSKLLWISFVIFLTIPANSDAEAKVFFLDKYIELKVGECASISRSFKYYSWAVADKIETAESRSMIQCSKTSFFCKKIMLVCNHNESKDSSL